MSIIRKRIIETLKEEYDNIQETFGYITKEKRYKLNLNKSHFNDAFCIANGKISTKRFCL